MTFLVIQLFLHIYHIGGFDFLTILTDMTTDNIWGMGIESTM